MKHPVTGRKTSAVAGFLAAAFLLLSGCQAAPPTPPCTEGIDYRITATCGELTVSGTLTRPSPATLSLALTEPATLKGLTLRWDGTQLTATWHGLSVPLNREELPDTALIEGLIGALEAAPAAENRTVTEEGVLTEGNLNGNAFHLLSDPTTGALIKLEIPTLAITVAFA